MYRLTNIPGIVLRLADGASIPLSDPDGAGQREYFAWLAAGNTPEPYAPPPPGIPQEVTRRQARQALLLGGLVDKVQPAIDAIADPTQRALMQIEWEDSQTFQRSRPALISLATALGLDDAQLDALFIKADTL